MNPIFHGMRTITFLMAGLAFLVTRCHPGPGNQDDRQLTDATDTEAWEAPVLFPPDSGVILLELSETPQKVYIHKKKNQTVYIQFASTASHRMTALLNSDDPKANIRFTQIFMPDGQTDGPFGRAMHYKLPLNGDYKIAIHENMMAGDPWSGEFTVTLSLDP